MSDQNEVLSASKQFYSALNQMANGDAGPLADIWAHNGQVSTMHPIGGRQTGWDAVRDSFEQVARGASGGKIELTDQIVHVYGEVAYEMGVERGEFQLAGIKIPIDHRVTNIYRKEGSAWKMIHHHTDTSPAMIDVIQRMGATST